LFFVSLSSCEKQQRSNKKLSSGGGPYFRSVSSAREVKVHERITFECDVGNLGKNIITWYNVTSGRIIFAGSVNVIGDERLRIGEDGKKLHLGDITEFDSGVYRCQVEVRSRPLKLEHKLNVLGKLFNLADLRLVSGEIRNAAHLCTKKYISSSINKVLHENLKRT
jgi:hypothetical protein